jgi:uncharacterized protein (TIGR03792 family)
MAVIEHLVVRVPVAGQRRYLSADAEVWTAMLARQPGFAGKEIWADEDDPECLHLIIRWASREDWDAIPKPLLEATEAAFQAAIGGAFPVESCTAHRTLV